jgi:hypothetical protein
MPREAIVAATRMLKFLSPFLPWPKMATGHPAGGGVPDGM